MTAFGNTETRVPHEMFIAAGVEPRGEMWAAMLDTKQSWDDLVSRHAPDPKTRDAILSNSIYQNISGRFIQSHDYIAMERLYEIHSSGTYDLIVVDTPPTRNAIDFLEAAELAVTLRRTRAGHLATLRAALDPTLPMLYVPYLFSRSHGARATRQVAEYLAEEL